MIFEPVLSDIVGKEGTLNGMYVSTAVTDETFSIYCVITCIKLGMFLFMV